MIDLNLLKQVADFADWFVSLPTKLVEAVLAPREAYLQGKEEIARLQELRALREIGEQVQSLYIFKGNIYQWANRLQAQQQTEEVEEVRELFIWAADALAEAEKILRRAPLSNLTLASEAARRISEAKKAYEALSTLPDADILGDRGLIDIIAEMDRLKESGSFLLAMADHHRERLESGGS